LGWRRESRRFLGLVGRQAVLDLPEKRLEEGPGPAAPVDGVLPERLVEEPVYLEEDRLPGGIDGSGGKTALEGLPGLLEHPGPCWAVTGPKDLHEERRLPQAEAGGADRQSGGHLLPGGETTQLLGDAHPEEPGGEDVPDFRDEAPSDLEPSLDPGLPPDEPAGHGAGRQPLPLVEIPQDLGLLAEARPSPWIVAAQTLELGLGPRPGLHQNPGTSGAELGQGQVALEAVDEEEPASFLDHEQGLLMVHVARAVGLREEIERDLSERYLPESHGSPRSGSSGSASTWKVGYSKATRSLLMRLLAAAQTSSGVSFRCFPILW